MYKLFLQILILDIIMNYRDKLMVHIPSIFLPQTASSRYFQTPLSLVIHLYILYMHTDVFGPRYGIYSKLFAPVTDETNKLEQGENRKDLT